MQAFATRFEDPSLPSKKVKESGFSSEIRNLPKNHSQGTYLVWNGHNYKSKSSAETEDSLLLGQTQLTSALIQDIIESTKRDMDPLYNPNPWRPGKWTTVVSWVLVILALAGWIVYLALGQLGASSTNIILSIVVAIPTALILTWTLKAIFRSLWRKRKQSRLVKSDESMRQVNQLLGSRNIPITARMSLHGAYIALEYDPCKRFYSRPLGRRQESI